MMKIVVLLCIVAAATTPIFGQRSFGDPTTLRLLHVFSRHGDRTPVTTYPNDPYPADSSVWRIGNGQLTNQGKQRAYNVGTHLRSIYGRFLESITPQNIRVRSTDYDRTIMSGQCLLAGLLPPSGEQIWDPAVNWQPIPVHTVPRKQDWLAQEDLCPSAKSAVEDALNSDEFAEENERNKDLYEYLETHTGMSVKTADDVADIYGTLTAEHHYNLRLPPWTRSVYPDNLTAVAAASLRMVTSTPELKQLFAGPSLQEVSNHLTAAKENITGIQTRVYLYMTHDKIIAAILSALGLSEEITKPPPYSATIIVELHEHPGNLSVRVLYYNDTNRDPTLFKLPGCTDRVCPLDKFLEVIEPSLPADDGSDSDATKLWRKQCGYALIDDDDETGISVKDVVIAVLAVLSICLLLLVICLLWMRKKSRRKFTNKNRTPTN